MDFPWYDDERRWVSLTLMRMGKGKDGNTLSSQTLWRKESSTLDGGLLRVPTQGLNEDWSLVTRGWNLKGCLQTSIEFTSSPLK